MKPRWKALMADHTGYYNEQDHFPVFTVERITMRRKPDLPQHLHRRAARRTRRTRRSVKRSLRAAAAKTVSPEITDFYLPPEGCSYRMAVVSMKKQYAGHAKRVNDGLLVVLAPVYVHQIHHRGG